MKIKENEGEINKIQMYGEWQSWKFYIAFKIQKRCHQVINCFLLSIVINLVR